jgi:hypothetical protein
MFASGMSAFQSGHITQKIQQGNARLGHARNWFAINRQGHISH